MKKRIGLVLLLALTTAGFGPIQPAKPAKKNSSSASGQIAAGSIVSVERIDPAMARAELVGKPNPRVNGFTAQQRGKLVELGQANSDLLMALDDVNGTPFFMAGHFGKFDSSGPDAFLGLRDLTLRLPPQSQVHLAIAASFFDRYKEVLSLDHPSQELRLKDYQVDELGSKHLKFQQLYRGIPVWASELILHLDASDEIYAVNGRFEPTPNRISRVEPKLPQNKAIEIATSHLASRMQIQTFSLSAASLMQYRGPTAEKVIFPMRGSGEPLLAWMVNIRPNLEQDWYYFIEAQTGDVLFKYNATAYDGPATGRSTDLNGKQQTLNVYQIGASFFMIDTSRSTFNAQRSRLPSDPVGAIWTIDARSKDLDSKTETFQVTSGNNTWNDRSSVSGHVSAGVVFEYFKNTHGRKGIDDKGSTLTSVIHVTENNRAMDNAFWNRAAMAYGDGNTAFKPLAGALDVAAHEITHGVTQYSADLVYLSQSGALNESMSDVFGVMVDRNNLKIGEDIIRPEAFPTGALRDLENPNQGLRQGQSGWQPANLREYVQLPEDGDHDNGGVHANSGIPNHAAALIIKAIGRERTEKIYYRALTKYLTSRSQFSDARLAFAQAAGDLFGSQSAEVQAVNRAFDEVGIGDKKTPPPPPVPPASGTNFIGYVRPDYTIGLITPDGSLLIELSRMAGRVRHDAAGGDIAKLSVPRDGRSIWFTRTDGLVGFLDLSDLNNIREFQLSNLRIRTTGDIMNAAARPDAAFSSATGLVSGALALTSKDRPDPNAYIVDFNAGTSTQIRLRVPTTGEGVDSATILYADVIDWFADGNLIIYDALNEVRQAAAQPIQYWVFNILRAATKDSLPALPPQPKGVSVGNPQFGSTTSLLVAYNEIDDETGVILFNIVDYNQSKIFTLVDPDKQGFGAWRPTFSPDDRKVAFVDVRNINTAPLFGTLVVGDLGTGGVTRLQVRANNPEWFAKAR